MKKKITNIVIKGKVNNILNVNEELRNKIQEYELIRGLEWKQGFIQKSK